MKKVTLAIAMAALILFAGCKKDTTTTTSTLKASIEQNQGDGSKTSLVPISDTDAEIRWTEGDQILVSNGTSTKTFTITNGAGSTSGTFTCTGEYELGTNNMAVYPATGTFSGNTLGYTLPAEQNGGVGTFANGANPMLAVSDNDNLTFKSLCGVLGLSLTGDNIAITAIEIVDNGTGNNSMLNGAFTATYNPNQPDNPIVLAYAGTGGTNSVRLNCTTTLTSEAKEFYIVLPVGTLASTNGFTMNLYNGADLVISKTRGAALEMLYNTVRKMNTFNVTLAPVVTAPEVTTGTASPVMTDGATCAGTVTSDGNGTVTAWGITYSTTEGFNGADGTHVAGGPMDGAGDFSASLTGLDSGTTYYYRAYATNEVGTTYGDIESFPTTAIVAPTVTTGAATNITGISAICGGTVTSDGNGNLSAYGIRYSTDPNMATGVTSVDGTNYDSGNYTATLTGLTVNTTYYYCAYATNEAGIGCGDTLSFKTIIDLTYLTQDLTAQDGDVLTGTLGGNYKISIADGAAVTLNNVNITCLDDEGDWAGLTCEGDATITLEGENFVESGAGIDGSYTFCFHPGIEIPKDKTLIINGSGALNASCYSVNHAPELRWGSGAGIGGVYKTECGNIIIESGTVTAIGGTGAAGIGGGMGGSIGNITINGGTVTATGGDGGAGIGCGFGNDPREASYTCSACGNITIIGGNVTANGGKWAAGIGSGIAWGFGQSSSAGFSTSTCGNISITGGTVVATGGAAGSVQGLGGTSSTEYCDGGAGIGTGASVDNNQGSSYYYHGGKSNCGDITIGSGVTSVTATKGSDAEKSIGKNHSNNQGTCGTVTIGGTVYSNGATPNQSDGVTFIYPVTETTITWNSSYISSINHAPFDGDGTVSNSGITASFNWGAGLYDSGIQIWSSSEYQLTFSSTVGNISKIEISSDYVQNLPEGQGWSLDGSTVTWEGTPASSVTLSGNDGFDVDININGISQIVFTVQ